MLVIETYLLISHQTEYKSIYKDKNEIPINNDTGTPASCSNIIKKFGC